MVAISVMIMFMVPLLIIMGGDNAGEQVIVLVNK